MFKLILRIKMAAHILRGRPIMYRINVEGHASVVMMQNTMIIDCLFIDKELPAAAPKFVVPSTKNGGNSAHAERPPLPPPEATENGV